MRLFTVIVMSLALLSCATMQAIETPFATQIPARIHAGDKVRITWPDGTQYRLEVTTVGKDQLVGVEEASGKSMRVTYAEMRSIDVLHPSRTKTMVTTFIPLYIITVVAALALVVHFIRTD